MKSQYIVLDLVKILIKCKWLLPANEPFSEKKKMYVNNCGRVRDLPYFQVNKLACHSYMDSDRKHKTSGPET